MKKSMGITSKNHISEFVDWFETFNQTGLKSLHDIEREKKSPFCQIMWPAGGYYYSPLNSTFLAQNFNSDYLKDRKVVLARDGAVPLLWYFNRFKKPPSQFKGKLLIHEEASDVVPVAWLKSVGFYRVYSSHKPDFQKLKTLVLTGVASEHFLTREELDEKLQDLIEFLGSEKITSLEKICVFPQGSNHSGSDDRHDYYADFFIKICAKLGVKNLKSMAHGLIEGITSLQDHGVIEFNQRRYCADNYTIHAFLRRGATFVDFSRPKFRGYERVAFSPHHGVDVCFNHKLKDVDKISKEKYLLSPTNTRIPWQDWLK